MGVYFILSNTAQPQHLKEHIKTRYLAWRVYLKTNRYAKV